MICSNCGRQNVDGAAFCVGCGASLAPAPVTPAEPDRTVSYQDNQYQQAPYQQAPYQQNPAPYYPAPVTKTKNNKPLIIGIVAAVVVAVVVLGIVFLGGGNSYESVAKDFAVAAMKGDAKTVVNLLPGEVIDAAIEEGSISDKQDMVDLLDYALSGVKEAAEEEYGKNYKVSAKVTDTDDYSNSELKDLQEKYDDNGIDIKISEAKLVTLEYEVSGNGEKESEELPLTVIKVGGKWYADIASLGF